MAIELITGDMTPNEGFEITNDNVVDLDQRLNELGLDGERILSGEGVPLSTQGFDGDFYFDTLNDTYYGPKVGDAWGSATSLVGSPGASGSPAYTTTTGFTQPASGATVSAEVGSTAWIGVGQSLYVETGGYYTVSSITDADTVVLTNSGYPGNAAPGVVVGSGSRVSPGGTRGADGVGGGSSGGPAWMNQAGAGSIFAAYADGDPVRQAADLSENPQPVTANDVGFTAARVVVFRIPKTLAVDTLRLFSLGSHTNIYNFAIYRRSDGVKMWAHRTSETSVAYVQYWTAVTYGCPFTLAANTDYCLVMSCVASSSLQRMLTRRSPAAAAGLELWRSAYSFGSTPNPMFNRGFSFPEYGQFPVSSGALPDVMPATAFADPISAWVGQLPFFFLEGTAS